MKLQAESLLLHYIILLLFYTLTLTSHLQPGRSEPSQDCDNGKAKLETDLLPPDDLLCPEPRPHSTLKLLSISTTYPVQPAVEVCMDLHITYNHTIPTSGAHRPVGAISGQYRYCPPQRWINNLKGGAVVLLFHPCAPEDPHRSLATMARSCLPHFVLSAHPELSRSRPFALVSWGRTLEVSHLTKVEVCDWLSVVPSNQVLESQTRAYRMYLTRAAPADRKLRVKPVGTCCLEALSAYERQSARARKIRAALSRESPTDLNSTRTPLPNGSEDESLPVDLRAHRTLHADSNSKQREGGGSVGTADTDRKKLKQQKPSGGKKVQEKAGRTSDARSRLQDVGKQRVKADTEQLDDVSPPRGLRTPLQRSDEAVWAAAALGFLFVLLTLSVLHSGLYRHWRRPSTLYWYESQQDYESVADIIRRRLKMVGRRKRRPSQSRRHECPPLLPQSSTDNDSD